MKNLWYSYQYFLSAGQRCEKTYFASLKSLTSAWRESTLDIRWALASSKHFAQAGGSSSLESRAGVGRGVFGVGGFSRCCSGELCTSEPWEPEDMMTETALLVSEIKTHRFFKKKGSLMQVLNLYRFSPRASSFQITWPKTLEALHFLTHEITKALGFTSHFIT